MQAKRAAARQQAAEPGGHAVWPIPVESEWDPPPSSDTYVYHVSATARISERIGRRDGRLVYFAIMLDCETNGEWKNIWRIDCSDDSVHRHVYPNMKDRSVIRPIRTQNDVESTYATAIDEVETRWQEIESGWRDGTPYRA
ncbi:hypothetical protein ACIQUC_13015 [Curtobacterium sp. NPDC098951]|uniref:DUF7718 family protein n=1 Tax=Curtobacterium sp. NPDC098951 TaxID=3363974 RepID=UPI0038030342